ncbi:putative Transcriptional regulator MarR family [Firmicutes bacterium CAG:475]|jgi:Transcriptional regulators|nr:MarR family transcriptional regulator [Clostridia bacterium]MBS5850830.1 MarR family transcriptional regulator [Bacillota bacterium]CDD69166.1 putative Transcriptional regulator MarR family [Firmicutes bacterium CAG:475]
MDLKNTAYFFAAFRKLLKSYTDYQLKELKGYDLTPNEIVVLSSIGVVGMASDIAQNACVSKALVSRSVKELREKGLISASISEVDKREQKLSLTPEGEKAAQLIADANQNFYKVAFRRFEDNEKRVLQALLQLMLNNLDEEGE